ncbi:hypothetical protein F2Q69_00019470 [Brassica cretica]|uniref:Uncharacterized protein n=1 Tax=Brassica cretica TaxID=69181 RepID=A0A8S9QAC1_BRACR|nr:hypothetical protein F2Q69_00019470 [Brassica cretica]
MRDSEAWNGRRRDLKPEKATRLILLYKKLCGGNASHLTRARKGSLLSDRTRAPLGRNEASEFEPRLGRNVATERPFRSVTT